MNCGKDGRFLPLILNPIPSLKWRRLAKRFCKSSVVAIPI
jgi:hypothetical protein